MQVYKEAAAALHSIFSQTDMVEFVKETKDKKIEVMTEISKLTSGIRLFNRDCKKGGKGIEDCEYFQNLESRKLISEQTLKY